MAHKRALLVGLTSVDPTRYRGNRFEQGCEGCERDVDRYVEILAPLGYQITSLKTADATSAAILGYLESAAKSLSADDMLVFCFCGHGGSIPDRDGDESRADFQDDGVPGNTGRDDVGASDEVLLAFDRPIVDDTLGSLWPQFRAGVRILMISDSCHAGTNFQVSPPSQAMEAGPTLGNPSLPASLIHLGASRDLQKSAGFGVGGALTLALTQVWNGGHFQGNYRDFHTQIATMMQRNGPFQVPTLHALGADAARFLDQHPFASTGS